MLYSPAFSFSSVYPLGVLPCAGLRLGSGASFKLFWPPALAGRAPLAIILQAPRRLRGAALFHGLCPIGRAACRVWVLLSAGAARLQEKGRRLTVVR